MKIDIEFTAQSVEISGSSYNEVNVEVTSADINSLMDAIGEKNIFNRIALDDYIDWADTNGKTPDILERLDPDDIIDWLRADGKLEPES